MSLADYIPARYRSLFSDPEYQQAQKGYFEYLLNEDKEFKEKVKQKLQIPTQEERQEEIKDSFSSPEFKNAVETTIIESDLKILPRIRVMEKSTGNYHFEDWEEHEPTLPEQITEMKEKINYFESARVIVPANMEPGINEDLLIQNTTLTQKANAIYEYIKTKVKPNWAGRTVIENEGIYSFFFDLIEEKLRWPEKLRGKRSAKKSIIERAVELHPDELELVKNKSGNKITGLALKPCVKRIDTYA